MFHHLIFSLSGFLAALTTLALSTPGIAPCLPGALQRYEFSEPHMGTRFRIVLYAADEATAKKAAQAAFAKVAELNKIMSDYQADSELMLLCKQAGGEPVPVSADLFAVLKKAGEFSEASEGAFDVSVGPLARLWRRARRLRELPDAKELEAARKKVDYAKVRLRAEGRTVQLLLEGMLLDLGGIAKGYAADAALAVLRAHGITRALVAAGGDIRLGDPPPAASTWKIGIAPLKQPNADPTHFLALKNCAVSTSGDAEQHLEIAGTRYSHIIDPKTGAAQHGRRSATVVAPDATTSDALATAVSVLGADHGTKLVARYAGCEMYYVMEIDKNFREYASKGFKALKWSGEN